jgi:hypothetical protein
VAGNSSIPTARTWPWLVQPACAGRIRTAGVCPLVATSATRARSTVPCAPNACSSASAQPAIAPWSIRDRRCRKLVACAEPRDLHTMPRHRRRSATTQRASSVITASPGPRARRAAGQHRRVRPALWPLRGLDLPLPAASRRQQCTGRGAHQRDVPARAAIDYRYPMSPAWLANRLARQLAAQRNWNSAVCLLPSLSATMSVRQVCVQVVLVCQVKV